MHFMNPEVRGPCYQFTIFMSGLDPIPSQYIKASPRNRIRWDVSIPGFVIEELDSVQFHHDILFCLESDSIVVPFSSSTSFLRVDIRQFWFQHITCYFLSSCITGVLLFLSTTYERELVSTRTEFVT